MLPGADALLVQRPPRRRAALACSRTWPRHCPDVSADGLTWTIAIKPGLHYGPPLQGVEITAQDFIRSFHRLLSPAFAMRGGGSSSRTSRGRPSTRRARPTPSPGSRHPMTTRSSSGSLPHEATSGHAWRGRRGAAAARPMASRRGFGIAEGADEGVGRFLVSSGPYMLEGSEALDFVQAGGRAGARRRDRPRQVTLVRNPSWDAASDALRPAYADRIEIVVVGTMDAAVAAIDGGTADLLWSVRARPRSRATSMTPSGPTRSGRGPGRSHARDPCHHDEPGGAAVR